MWDPLGMCVPSARSMFSRALRSKDTTDRLESRLEGGLKMYPKRGA